MPLSSDQQSTTYPRRGRTSTHARFTNLLSEFGNQPFTLSDVVDLGISRAHLRSLERCGYLTRLRHGLYSLVHPESLPELSAVARARVALAPFAGMDAVITGPLAGELHQLPFIHPPSSLPLRDSVEIMVLESQGRRCGYRDCNAVVRRVRDFPADITVIDGIPVTSVIHAAIDIVRMGYRTTRRSRAASLLLPESLVVLDAATARAGASDSTEAVDLIATIRSRFRYGPGIRSVDAVAELIDPCSESPLESWSRGHMFVFGVPTPKLQQHIVGADGVTYRVDFCWPDCRVLAEADGLAKYGTTPAEVRRAKNRELLRQRALEAAGWTVIRWTWDELLADPKVVMARINRALRAVRTDTARFAPAS